MTATSPDPTAATDATVGENGLPSHSLRTTGYITLLATQFFGAANDNILKQCLTFMVATGIWSGSFGRNGLGDGGQVVPALFLTLPFILLSGYAGQISDKYSKRRVMYWVKVVEIPIAIIAMIGFLTHDLWLSLLAMLMLSVQSSFFGPAKYGVIPEIVHDDRLSMANGVINMLTNVAVIAGSLVAGPLCDLFHPQPPPIPAIRFQTTDSDVAIPARIVVRKDDDQSRFNPGVFVVRGTDPMQGNLLTLIEKSGTSPAVRPKVASALSDIDGDGTQDEITMGQTVEFRSSENEPLGKLTLQRNGDFEFTAAPNYFDLAAEPTPWAPGLAMVLVAIAGYLSIVGFPSLPAANPTLKFDWNPFGTYIESIKFMAQGPLLAVVLAWAAFYMIAMIALLILPEYQQILLIDFAETSYLLGILGIAIAIGSVVTGLVSGKQIRPWLIPFGAGGMCIAFLLLGTVEPTYLSVALLILMAGFFAGFYIVPLQALIQLLSPDEERGRIIGTSGAISFCFSSLGPIVFWVAKNPLGMAANRIFLICAAMAIIGTVYGAIQLKKIMAYRAQQESISEE